MLTEKMKEYFEKHNGRVTIRNNQTGDITIYTVTEDGKGFKCDKGPAIYPFDSFDLIQHDLELIAKPLGNQIYFGESISKTRLGEADVDMTLNAIINRLCWNKKDGKTMNNGVSYIAPLLVMVGYATINKSYSKGRYISLVNMPN